MNGAAPTMMAIVTTGTGGTDGVGYLTETLKRRCFPELWSLRTRL